MRSALRLWVVVAVLSVSGAALGHPRGFHKRVRATVTGTDVELLVSVDLDGGKQALQVRQRADANLDGVLSEGEQERLKQRLVQQLLNPLRVSVGGQALRFAVEESKLSLREQAGVAEVGISAAALIRARLAGALIPGMKWVLEDESPDHSHVLVEVQTQFGASDGGGAGPVVRQDLKAGERFEMTLRP